MFKSELIVLTLRVLFVIASASWVSAGQLTLIEFSVTDLQGNFTGPAPVFGSVTGPISSTFMGSSMSADGQYQQTYNGSASASAMSLTAAASEGVTCLKSSCGPYALPFSANAGSADYEPGISSLAWWNDVMTVQPGPGFASLNFVFNVHGTLSQSGSGNASDTSAFMTGETCSATEDFCHGGVPRHVTNVPLPTSGNVTVNLTPWLLNQPFEYEFILDATAATIPNTVGMQGYINGNSSASTDFSNTARLIAIVPVDAQGNPVSGTTITSASGVVLPVAAVPEPSTFACMTVAGIVFGVLMIRRRLTSA